MAEAIEELIELERSAEQKRVKLAGHTGTEYDAQWRHWREAIDTAQSAVTAHAAAAGDNRYELEHAA
ncbi:hypothetical protein [Streptomyces sp. NPDC007905]|uniref:hypothetical protein n=1 Tax=Streptomyces sp. NPDC007905 TaxID=3364788 RepID=UPI0036EB4442